MAAANADAVSPAFRYPGVVRPHLGHLAAEGPPLGQAPVALHLGQLGHPPQHAHPAGATRSGG